MAITSTAITLSGFWHSVRTRLAEGTASRKIAGNTIWLVLGQLSKLAIGLVLGVLVARYLGPHDFGILSYSLSLTAFLSTFVYLGLSGIIVRDIVAEPDETGLLLGSTLALKLVGSCLSYGILLLVALRSHTPSEEMWVLVIVGASLLFRPWEVLDFWFQSRTESKYSILAKFAALLIKALATIVLIVAGASILAFAAINLAEVTLAAGLLAAIYAKRGQAFRAWRVQIAKVLSLLKESWVLILSGFLALVYLKVDQIMLRWLIGPDEVGIYSVAVRFSEVWYFIPSAIAISVFPKLVEIRQKSQERYEKRLQQGFDLLFVSSLPIAIVMTFAGGLFIHWLYGAQYDRAGNILAIHVWAGVFVFLRALFSKWVVAERLLLLSLLSQGLGALTNVILNVYLIPVYGGLGAATATLISYAVASYFALFITPGTWPVAKMMSKAICLPLRVLLYRGRIWA